MKKKEAKPSAHTLTVLSRKAAIPDVDALIKKHGLAEVAYVVNLRKKELSIENSLKQREADLEDALESVRAKLR